MHVKLPSMQKLNYISEPEVTNGPYDPIQISAKYHDKVTNRSYDGKIIILSDLGNIGYCRALSSNFGKGPWPKLGKNDRLDVKLGKNYQQKT